MTEDTNRLHQLRTMPYEEYLQTPEWLERREQALQRADYRCQVCYTPDNLNVHHRTYERRGNERPSDLTVLCERHHFLFHLSERIEESGTFHSCHLASAAMDALEEVCEGDPAISTGYGDIDRLIRGWQKEQLYLVTGYSESGKSSFLLGASIIAAYASKRVLFLSLETDIAALAVRATAWNAQIDTSLIRHKWLQEHEWEKIVEKTSSLHDTELWTSTPQETSFASLSIHITEHIREHGPIDMLVIDNISFIEPDSSKREGALQQSHTLCRNLKQLAKQHHVPVLASCPLPFPKERRAAYKPTLSDLRASNGGATEIYADMIMFLYREELYSEFPDRLNIIDVIVAKNRHGMKGELSLFFNSKQGRIENLERRAPAQE